MYIYMGVYMYICGYICMYMYTHPCIHIYAKYFAYTHTLQSSWGWSKIFVSQWFRIPFILHSTSVFSDRNANSRI